MTEKEIIDLNSPKNYKKRDSPMNKWLNVIFKMMNDGHKNKTIYFYIKRQSEFHENPERLAECIHLIGQNNFPKRPSFHRKYMMKMILPKDIVTIKKSDVLKYLLTVNPKTKKDETVELYIDIIKEKYPICVSIESTFKDFHSIIMGNEVELLDDFLIKYEGSKIQPFCNSIKRDIEPVRNAIISSVSSGFVEGNNNKFKLIKRTVYGRSKLENLTKKCKLAFLPKSNNFDLASLI